MNPVYENVPRHLFGDAIDENGNRLKPLEITIDGGYTQVTAPRLKPSLPLWLMIGGAIALVLLFGSEGKKR